MSSSEDVKADSVLDDASSVPRSQGWFTSVTESTFAISKPPMLALLTNQGSGGSPVWDVPDAGFGAGETVVDVLTCATFNADAHGGVTVTGSAGAPVVLLPQSVVSTSGGKLCA